MVATELHCRFAMAARRADFGGANAQGPRERGWRSNVARARRHFVDPKRLFAALDGRELLVSGRRWKVEVFSVRDLAGLRWIQLAIKGKSRLTFALKLDPGAGVHRAVEAVTSQLMSPTPLGDMSNVA
jgi:hypothetical protein